MARIVFAGTPAFACPALEALIAHPDHEVMAVYTQPDRPAGRRRQSMPSPVKQCAARHGIAIEQPPHFKDASTVAHLAAYRPDWMIVAAYGCILPQVVLDIPTACCINIHASLLPQWRGAAPIQRAILAGDVETGVTIMAMDVGLDTGDMLYRAPHALTETDTTADVLVALAQLGATSLIQTLDHFDEAFANRTPQDATLATYAHKLTKAEGRIDWHQPAPQLARQVRACHPWPSTFGHLDDMCIKVHAAHCHPNIDPSAQPGQIIACDDNGLRVATGQTASHQRMDLIITSCQLPNKPKTTPKAIQCGHPALLSTGKIWT